MKDQDRIRIDRLLGIQSSTPRPGCAVAVIRNGDIIFQQCYGMANLEDEIPISPRSVFNIGSISKQFTAFALGLLEQEGKLTLEDDIRRHLPELPDYGKPIRIRHLIHHTSGIRNSYPDLLWLAEWRDGDITTFEDAKNLIFAQKSLNFLPGEEFLYSNSNYVLLAEICARVSGMSFGKYCRESIFQPLEMHSSLIHDSCFMLVPRRALGYFGEDKGPWFLAPLNDAVAGPTNVYTDIPDLMKWDENFYTGRIGGHELVRQMCQPGTLDNGTPLEYGWGFDVGKSFIHRGWRTVEHSGSHGGYTSHMLRIPELHMSVIFLSNYFNMLATEMAWKVADLFLEMKPGYLPGNSKGKGRKLSSEPIPAAWLGTYYSPARDAIREVLLKDEKLYYDSIELVRSSGNAFQFRHDDSVRIEFRTDPKSVVTLTATSPYGTVSYYKVTPIQESGIEFSQYPGKFYCPELDVYWNVETREPSGLAIKRRKYPTTYLTPMFRDAFRDDWHPIVEFPFKFLVTFTRNEKKEITGLQVSGVGPRRIFFEKR
jgi:CubicO group peptidase (beta-lactamase class C family)